MRTMILRFTTSLLILSLILAGCNSTQNSTGSQTTEQPIKIGFFSDLTGSSAALGLPEANAARLVEKTLNSNGGLNRIRVQILVADSKSDENEAQQIAKKFIDEGVIALVGGTTTGASMAVASIAEKEHVPYVSLGDGVEIVRPVKPWVFKAALTEEIALLKISEYLKKKEIKKIAWISANEPYSESGKKAFEQIAPSQGFEIVASERFNLDEKDMSAQLTRIKSKEPQAIINWSNAAFAAIVTKNFAQLGFQNTALIQSPAAVSQAYLDQSGDAANGVIALGSTMFSIDTLPDSNPRKKHITDLFTDYQARFSRQPNAFAGYAYDALGLVAAAIENVGEDRTKVRDALERIQRFPGVTGTYSMSEQDHLGLVHNDSFVLLEVKEKKFRFVEGM